MRNTERLKGVAKNAAKATGVAASAAAKSAVVASGLMTAALAGSANAAMDFESAMADVRKVVDFDSPAQFKAFSEDIVDLSTRIPIAAQGLAEISAEAGAAGIALEDNLRFTEFVAKSAVAFDMMAGQAGDSFAKIRNVYTLTQTGVEDMADAVNHLSNSMASKAPEIIDFINRAGGAAPMLKASATQMAAIGSAMIATGTAPEVAARGITALATRLEVGDSKTRKALQSIGISHAELMKQIETNPGTALITLFEAIEKAPKGTEALKELVGQDFIDDFSKITARTDLLATSLELVGDKTAYAGSVQGEFATRAATTANSVDLLRNNLSAVAIEVGNQALPAINRGLESAIGFLQSAREESGRLQTAFAAITTVWSDFFGVLGSWGATVSNSLDQVFAAFSELGDTIGRIFSALSGGGEAASFGQIIGTTLAGAFDLLLTAVEKVAQGLNIVFTAVENLAPSLLGLFDGGTVSRYAEVITSVVGGAFEALKTAVTSVYEALKSLWSSGIEAVQSWTETISTSFGRVKEAFSGLGETIGRIAALFSDGEGASQLGYVVGTVLAGAFNTLLIAIEAVITIVDSLLKGLEGFIRWVQGKEIDWSTLVPPFPEIDTAVLKAGVDALVGIVEGGWNILSGIFDLIVSGAGKLGDAVGTTIEAAVKGAEAALAAISGSKGVDRIIDQLGVLAERGYKADFVQGQALTEALSAGEISLDSYRAALAAVALEGGAFAQTAREMVEASRQLDAFKMPEPPAPKLPPMAEIDTAVQKIHDIETAANAVPGTVRTAMTAVDGILAATNFTDRGIALMRTLAEGIRAGTHLVVEATAAATQKVRDHLPSSPAKTGPLSDIHRLKFGETIASSIRAEPMVAAMRGAAAATMAAALPLAGGILNMTGAVPTVEQRAALAAVSVPLAAAQSVLPSAREARSASAPAPAGKAGGGSAGAGATVIHMTYGDFHFDSASEQNLSRFKDELANHRREMKRLIDREDAREKRKEF